MIDRKLNALTSLRFFAAAMIVLLHTHNFFDVTFNWNMWSFVQGVSFFFVLSGFILTYVYSSLDNWRMIRRFWLARVARLWPAHIFAIFLGYLLIPHYLTWIPPPKSLVTASHFLLLNAWIPFAPFIYSYNIPSWSISTELFFYLFFPLLLLRLNKNWWFKLLLTLFSVLLMTWIASHFTSFMQIDPLVYVHPLSRIFEFLLGMLTAIVWRKKHTSINITKTVGTLLEIIAIAVVCFSLYSYRNLTGCDHRNVLQLYFAWCGGSAPAFCLLIFVMALEKGYIARFLSLPFMVLLGEISFSIYLLHYTFLRYYSLKIQPRHILTPELNYFIFWVVLILTSYLVWRVIERPSRKFILGFSSNKENYKAQMQLAIGWLFNRSDRSDIKES